ncbi:hypothetical protein PR202_ga10305 [Eleusine coracana subsp. coracana]|uniref:Uncharacterized protein n=1 Tax=Eleusine coracana subsp. coracana TaxID=191504 RepID=A0AAV5C6G7_ELECO|nr:hypothetical protein PR202_ga10305 [Eleusine coracana subsp. coracana]
MSGLRDSSDDPPPRPRGCCRAFASALCKIAKFLLHLGILLVIFILIFLGIGNYSFGTKIILEISFVPCHRLPIHLHLVDPEGEDDFRNISWCACCGDRHSCSKCERQEDFSRSHLRLCNFLALLAYCVWRFWALLQACLRRVRSSAAPPLLPVVQQEEAGCSSPVVQHAAFRIEDLPREFSHDELLAVTGDFGSMVGRGGSGEVFHGVLEDGAAVAVKRIIGNNGRRRGRLPQRDLHRRERAPPQPGPPPRLLPPPKWRGPAAVPAGVPVLRARVAGLVAVPRRAAPRGRRRGTRAGLPPPRVPPPDPAPGHQAGQHPPRRRAAGPRVGLRHLHVHRVGPHQRGHVRPGHPRVHGPGGLGQRAVRQVRRVQLRRHAARARRRPPLLREAGGGGLVLPSVVWEKTARGEVMEVADAAMAHVDEGEVEAVVKVALCCVQPRREMRPTMLAVVDMLEGRVPVDLPPESRLSVVNFSRCAVR